MTSLPLTKIEGRDELIERVSDYTEFKVSIPHRIAYLLFDFACRHMVAPFFTSDIWSSIADDASGAYMLFASMGQLP
jgi:hypothetical protein